MKYTRSSRFYLHFPVLCVLASVVLLVSCNSGAPQRERDELKTDGIFLDYQAIGDESLGQVTVRLQFRFGGPEGDAIMLDAPADVRFDGQPMDTGSSKMNGGYYEAVFPIGDEAELHRINYKDAFGRSYTDSFYFPFFFLNEEIPGKVSRSKELEIRLSGLSDGIPMHVMLTDTSFYGRGVDRIDSIANGKLVFFPQVLGTLSNGPIHIELYREDERILESHGRLRGRLYLSYNISREFELGE